MKITPLSEVQELIEEFKSSGLGQKEFCKNKGLPEWKFYHYQRRLRRADEKSAKTSFVEISNSTKNSLPFKVEVNGIQLKISDDFEAEPMTRFLKVILNASR